MIELSISGGIATITLDRPPVNAFDDGGLDELEAALNRIEAGSDMRSVLILGADGRFSAGADVRAIARRLVEPDAGQLSAAFALRMQRLFNRLAALEMPTICAIRGAAVGGGLELALACDLRVAADDARLGLAEVRLGLVPAAGGTQRLASAIGVPAALRMMLLGELITGRRAYELGLVQWIATDLEADDVARVVAAEVAEAPAKAAAAIKACVAAAGTPDGYNLEIESTRRLVEDDQTRERVAAFVNGHGRRQETEA